MHDLARCAKKSFEFSSTSRYTRVGVRNNSFFSGPSFAFGSCQRRSRRLDNGEKPLLGEI